MGRLRESFSLPSSEQRHPALMNAIFLWACFVSRPGPLSEHESSYLARCLDSLQDALQFPSRILDVIQASCMLALYFLSTGRMVEGSYHANAAASLAVQWHLNGSATEGPFDITGGTSTFRLPPPKDRIEDGERIMTFWQVYILDRCWSVVLHKPVVIQDGQNSNGSINAPWPLEVEQYEAVSHPEKGVGNVFSHLPP